MTNQWNFMTTEQLNAIEGSDRPCFKFIKFEIHPRYLAQVMSEGRVQMNNFAAAPHLQVMSEVNLRALPWVVRAYVARGQLECFKLRSEDIHARRCQEQVIKLGKSLLEAARNAQDALDELKGYKHKLDENEWGLGISELHRHVGPPALDDHAPGPVRCHGAGRGDC